MASSEAFNKLMTNLSLARLVPALIAARRESERRMFREYVRSEERWAILKACTVIGLVLALGIGCLLCLTSCGEPSKPEAQVGVEMILSDSNMPEVSDARVLVLPTGERVLVLTGGNGLATCCLLPPRQLEKKP